MKLSSATLFVLAWFAGSAVASMQVTQIAKVHGFSKSELCYLEDSVNAAGAPLIRSELERRKLICTAELRAKGQLVFNRRVRMADERATDAHYRHKEQSREARQENNRIAWCAISKGQSPGCNVSH